MTMMTTKTTKTTKTSFLFPLTRDAMLYLYRYPARMSVQAKHVLINAIFVIYVMASNFISEMVLEVEILPK